MQQDLSDHYRQTLNDYSHRQATLLLSAFDATEDGIILLDLTWKIVLLNQKARAFSARLCSEEININHSFWDYFSLKNGLLRANLEQLVMEGACQTAICCTSKSQNHLQIQVSLLLDGMGKPTGILVKLKELVAAFEPSFIANTMGQAPAKIIPDLLKTFMDHAPLAAWITDLSSVIQYMNTAFMNMYGFDKEDLGKSIFDLFEEDAANEYRANNLEVLQKGKLVEYFKTSLLPDGTQQTLKIFQFPFTVSGTSMIAGWAQDMTDKLQLHGMLIDKIEQFTAAQQATSDAIFDWKHPEKKVFLGTGFAALFGLEDQFVEFTALLQHIHPADLLKVKAAHLTALKNPAIDKWEVEYQFKCKDGTYRHVAEKGIIKRYFGKAYRVIGALQDVTPHKALQAKLIRQEKSSRNKRIRSIIEVQEKERRELSVELHDNVNQMLASCKLMLEVACDGGENAAKLTRKAYESTGAIITEIRKICHELNPSALQDVGLMEAITEMAETINATGKIQVSITEDMGACARQLDEVDAVTIYRIIQEQINNILKHAQAEKATISLAKKDSYLEIIISDNGIGMETDKVRKGLGLKNVQNRVEYYNGTLNVLSEPGKGTSLVAKLKLFE